MFIRRFSFRIFSCDIHIQLLEYHICGCLLFLGNGRNLGRSTWYRGWYFSEKYDISIRSSHKERTMKMFKYVTTNVYSLAHSEDPSFCCSIRAKVFNLFFVVNNPH